MAIGSLSVTWQPGINVLARNTAPGLPVSQGPALIQNIQSPSLVIGTGAANAAAGGSDEFATVKFTIVGGGNSTIDLTSVVDVFGSTISFARIKAAAFFLLSAGQATPDGTVGTACSGVSVGNAGGDGTNGQKLDLGAKTSTFTLGNGGNHIVANGNAAGWVVDGTNKLLYFVNNDGAVTAQLYVVLQGGTT